MKKFGKIFGVAVLAAATLTAGAVGLSGCGNNASIAEVQEYVASDTTINSMDAGYKLKISMPGTNAEGVVSFSEEGELGFALKISAVNPETNQEVAGEAYLRGNEIFAREGSEGKYLKSTVDFDDPTNDAMEGYAEFVQMADLSEYIDQFINVLKVAEGQGLKVSKSGKNGNVKYSMSYKDSTGKMSFVLEYKNDQITKFAYNVNAMGQVIVMEFELFTGDIADEYPADLDTNFELVEDDTDQDLAA